MFFLFMTVMIPKFACGCGNKDKAYQAMLKSDLRNLSTAEDAYYIDNKRYTSREPSAPIGILPTSPAACGRGPGRRTACTAPARASRSAGRTDAQGAVRTHDSVGTSRGTGCARRYVTIFQMA